MHKSGLCMYVRCSQIETLLATSNWLWRACKLDTSVNNAFPTIPTNCQVSVELIPNKAPSKSCRCNHSIRRDEVIPSPALSNTAHAWEWREAHITVLSQSEALNIQRARNTATSPFLIYSFAGRSLDQRFHVLAR